jgi:hypothetical protein
LQTPQAIQIKDKDLLKYEARLAALSATAAAPAGTRIGGYPTAWGLPTEEAARANKDAAALSTIINLRQGGQGLGSFVTPIGEGPSPAVVMARPILHTTPIVLGFLLLCVGLMAMTARQWFAHERLPFPLAEIPKALASADILRQRGFRVGLLLGLAFWIWQLSNVYHLNVLPRIPNPLVMIPDLDRLLGLGMPESQRWVYNYMGNWNFFPFAVGIGFLLAADIGFSVWGGFIGLLLLFGIVYPLGLPVSFGQHGRMVGSGATLAFAVVVLWLGRHHYWALLRAALGSGQAPGADHLGVWGVRALLLGAVLLVGLLGYVGGNFLAAALGVLVLTAFIVILARVVAESGLASFEMAEGFNRTLVGLGLPLAGLPAIMALGWLGSTVMFDTRENLAGYAVQSASLVQQADVARRRVLLIGASLAAFVAITAVFGYLWSAWGLQVGLNAGGGGLPVREFLAQQPALPGLPAQPVDWTGTWALVAGAGLLFAIVGLRRLWVGFPFHPLGLVLAASFPIYLVWFSLALGWAAKLMVLRYGGAQLYSRLKPAAIGLITADALGFGLQALIALITALLASWGVDITPLSARGWP